MRKSLNGFSASTWPMWQAMLQTTSVGFMLIDKNHRVILHNDAASRLYMAIAGIDLVDGIDVATGLREDRKNKVHTSIDAALEGEIIEYEVSYKIPVPIWIKIRYSLAFNEPDGDVGVCAVVEDITAQKMLEEAVRFREMKFASVFGHSAIGMALVSSAGRFMEVNASLAKLLGYTKDELLRLTFQDITHPEDLEQDLAFVRQLLQKEIESYQIEKRYFHRNGSVIWVMLTVSLVWHSDGSPNFFISQIVDISSTKVLLKELETKNHVLDFAAHDLQGKMKQLEEFTHMAGHNLRGATGNIKSLADLIEIADPSEQPMLVQKLKLTADSLLVALTELLQFSQVKLADQVIYEECDICALCNEVLPQVVPADMETSFALEYQLAFKTITYVKIYLQNALYNLFSNAFKYRTPGQKLIITVSAGHEADKKHLTVADNGIGFDTALNRDKIFQLNATFHNGYNSKGIGLFLTKAQLEKLGSSISVASRPGEGAAFTIIF